VSSNPATAAEPRSKPICIRFSVAALFPNGPNWAGREGDYLDCLRLTLHQATIRSEFLAACSEFVGMPVAESRRDSMAYDIRRHIREEGFFRQIMPPTPIGGEIEVAVHSLQPRPTQLGQTVHIGNVVAGVITRISQDGRTAQLCVIQQATETAPLPRLVNSPPPTNLRTTRRGDGVLVQWDHPDPTSYTFHVHIAYDESDWQEVGRTANTEILDDDPPLGWAQYRVIAIPYEGVPDEVSFDYERSSVTHEPIWLEQTAGEILQDLVLERCRAMCPMVSEFSYRAVQERNLMIQRLAQTVVDQRLLVDTFRNAMANPPPGWQITGEHFGRPVPGGIP
jgi:hypothetical protein